MRLWPLVQLRRARPALGDKRQGILPLDEREADLLRRHRATREIQLSSSDAIEHDGAPPAGQHDA